LINKLTRLFHTARHLRPSQVGWRIWHRLHTPSVPAADALPLREWGGIWSCYAYADASMLGESDFLFLGVQRRLAGPGDWNRHGWEKLWLYNLHYFDDLNARAWESRSESHRALIDRWIAENPAPLGNGWEPYPTSLRIVNWIKWFLAGNHAEQAWLASLAQQVRWLERRLEYHLLGNHLFANLKALIFAGAYFQGEEAERWLALGCRLLAQELEEQVLPDGGHFELSPMYHAIILQDLLDLYNLQRKYPGVFSPELLKTLDAAIQSMRRWAGVMQHPDGDIPFFNDAAFGIAARPAQLEEYACSLDLPPEVQSAGGITHLGDSGYLRVEHRESTAFIDVARVGPDYIPGHAHADTLSFELSLFGQRVFVNGGTSEYGTDEIRQYERGTAAHNTVAINGDNSSEMWDGFRVARRAYPSDLVIEEQDGLVTVSCAHDGYMRLKGKPIHHRGWQFSNRELIVEDRIRGAFQSANAYFHLHPAIDISANNLGSWKLRLPEGQQVCIQVEKGDAELKQSYYAPEFGKRLESRCLKIALEHSGSRVRIGWSVEN